jgi:hypothetical protein
MCVDDDSGFDEAFDSILAGLGSPAAEAAATEVAAPVDADSPTEETEAVEDGSTDEPEAEQTVDEPPALPETPVAAAPPEIDWNRPELKQVAEKAQRMDAIERSLQEAARLRAQQMLAETETNLADGDPERQQQLAQYRASLTEPLRRQAQQHEHVATQTAQTAAALHIAIRSVVPEALQEQVFAEAKHLTQYQDANARRAVRIWSTAAAVPPPLTFRAASTKPNPWTTSSTSWGSARGGAPHRSPLSWQRRLPTTPYPASPGT